MRHAGLAISMQQRHWHPFLKPNFHPAEQAAERLRLLDLGTAGGTISPSGGRCVHYTFRA